jgi:hypothetical protein
MIIKIGQEPTEREPDALDNLTEREPKSPMIARPSADDCKPLQIWGDLIASNNKPFPGAIVCVP